MVYKSGYKINCGNLYDKNENAINHFYDWLKDNIDEPDDPKKIDKITAHLKLL